MTTRLGPPMTRRGALAALGLGAAAGCAPGGIGGDGVDGDWYAMAADLHVAADPAEGLRGEVMADNARAVVAAILDADRPPRGVILAGDLAFKTGEPGDYATLRHILRPLDRSGLPIHAAVGNHDDRSALRSAFGGPDGKRPASVRGPGVRFILLDSQDGVNVTRGRLGDEQVARLARDLDAHPAVPTILCLHHDIDLEKRAALADSAALMDALRPRRQVKAVAFGHTHAWGTVEVEGLHLINLPAAGYRAHGRQPLGWVALRATSKGAEVELRGLSGDRDRIERRTLAWRSA